MTDYLRAFFSFGVSVSAVWLALFIFKKIWISRFPAEIPTKQKTHNEKDNYHRLSTLRQLWQVFIPLWREFDAQYWVQNVGLDAYSYIYFQREILKMLMIFGIFSLSVYVPFVLWLKDIEVDTGAAETDSIMHSLFLYFFTIYCVFTMFKIRRGLKQQILLRNQWQSTSGFDIQNFMMRSVHVKGVLPEDRRAEFLRAEIEQYLDNTGGGKVLSIVNVPDFAEIIDLENQRNRLENAQRLLDANEPYMRRLCLPKRFKDESYYQSKLKEIDDALDKAVMKPVLSSGHAFILFDSAATMRRCLNFFKLDPQAQIEMGLDLLKDKIKEGKQILLLNRARNTSTFGKFNDEEIIRGLEGKGLVIDMARTFDPVDIFWVNMGGTRGFYFFRRLALSIAAILILLFLTTPAVLFKTLAQTELFSFLEFYRGLPKDTLLGYMLNEFLPPLIIISLNVVLLWLIDYSAYMERHYTYSGCQLSIYRKSVIYLLLNMLVIPGLTLTAGKSLFTLIFQDGYNLTQALTNFYYTDAGDFFILVLIQTGCLSGASNLLRVGEIMSSFGSPWLAHYRRTYLCDIEKWRRRETDTFPFGYSFAQMVCNFAIVMTFSPTKPILLLPGMLYFFIRHLVDSYNILVNHRKEIDSSCRLIENVLGFSVSTCAMIIFIYSVSFFYNKHYTASILTLILFAITVFLATQVSHSIYVELEPLGSSEIQYSSSEAEEAVKFWEKAYSQPLLVSNTELLVQTDKRTVGYVLNNYSSQEISVRLSHRKPAYDDKPREISMSKFGSKSNDSFSKQSNDEERNLSDDTNIEIA